FFVFSPVFNEATAVTLSVGSVVGSPGENLQAKILIDDSSEVAGLVCTVRYDTSALTLESVSDNGFFDVFTSSDEIAGVGRSISAARAQTGEATCEITLDFRIKTDEETDDGYVTGDYEITVMPTVLNYPPAGYDTDTTINILWGLDTSQDPFTNPGLAYPKLTTEVLAGKISIDRDGDGLTDVEENALGTDRDNQDTDADGMPDGWEVEQRLNPLDSSDSFVDLDGDGFCNLREYISATNPRKSSSKPSKLIADFNDDDDVDGYELSELAREFQTSNCASSTCYGDLDGNGVVDQTDLRLFVEEFGRN
ncbi:MAG TPA: hypothetical protein ENG51_04670, partial [Deltaproteobacteria bacterium]|nr:hypothetical protein [Deltaproteobacteria bacterium]